MTDLTPEQTRIYEIGEELFWRHIYGRKIEGWDEVVKISLEKGTFGDTDIMTFYVRENGFPNIEEVYEFIFFMKRYYKKYKTLPTTLPKRDLLLSVFKNKSYY